jgi:hypothetical protein
MNCKDYSKTYQRLSRSSSYIHNVKLEFAKTQSIIYKSQLHKKINAILNGVQWPNLI